MRAALKRGFVGLATAAIAALVAGATAHADERDNSKFCPAMGLFEAHVAQL